MDWKDVKVTIGGREIKSVTSVSFSSETPRVNIAIDLSDAKRLAVQNFINNQRIFRKNKRLK